MSFKQAERVTSYANNVRRVHEGEDIREVYGTIFFSVANRLLWADKSFLADAYLDLGKRLPDEYSIEVDDRMLDSARTTDIEGVRALLPDVLANGYRDAKIVRVATFTQELQE